MLSRFFKRLRSFVAVISFVVIMAIAVLCTPSTALAQLRVFVDEDSTATTPTGASWPLAFRHLSEGIDEAVLQSNGGFTPVQVWVAEGVYRPDENEANPTGTNPPDTAARSMTFEMHENVKLYGGFIGNESADGIGFNARRPLENITTLSGDLDEDGLDNGNSFHVVTAIMATNSATIDGFTITMGYAVDAPFPGYPVDSNDNIDNVPVRAGGGMYILSRNGGFTLLHAFPNVVRCTFQNNKAEYGGAVLQHGPWHGFQTWVNCVFKDNEATVAGGAFYNYGMSDALGEALCDEGWSGAHMYNCLFHDNTAPNGAGGAYWADHTTGLKMYNGTVADNSSGVFQDFDGVCGSAKVWNSILYNNGTCPGNNCAEDQIDGQYCINYSCVQGFTASTEANCDDEEVIDVDPDFVSGYQLDPSSLCVNVGDDLKVPFDSYDLFQAGTIGPNAPDLLLLKRIVVQVDLGV